MHTGTRRKARYARPIQELVFSPWVLVPLALIVGAFLAFQFFNLQARYVKLVVGMLLVATIVRLPMASSIVVFVLVFSIPTFVFLTDSNVLLIGLLVGVSAVKILLGTAPRLRRSPIDYAILVYLGFHVLSFINMESPDDISRAIQSMHFIVAGPFLYWVMYNSLRTEKQLVRVLQAFCGVAVFVDVGALVEYFFAGYRLIPDWYLYEGGGATSTKERVGSVFGYHALLADFTAIVSITQLFLLVRAKTNAARLWYFTGIVLGAVIIALTVNRGGVTIWLLGITYFGFFMREHIPWARIAILTPVAIGLVVGVRALLGLSTGQLRVMQRLLGTRLEGGVIDTRALAWSQVWSRIPEHFWLGHGPYFKITGAGQSKIVWPHSAYLFYWYTIGLLGLLSWLWIMVKMLWKTFPGFKVDFARAPLALGIMALMHVEILMFMAGQGRASHLRGNVSVYVMWMLLAIGAAAARIVQQRKREKAAVEIPPAPTGPTGVVEADGSVAPSGLSPSRKTTSSIWRE